MAEHDHAYWESVPEDNQQVYRHFIRNLKVSGVIAAIVIAYLFYRALS